MLSKPDSCGGCALQSLGTGFMRPSLSVAPIGVALIGEALGADEAAQGAPFVGAAGFRLTRLIEWAGYDRSRFDIFNTVWCRPDNNKLEGTPHEIPAIAHCREAHWGKLLDRSRVLVPMGNVPTGAIVHRKGILSTRGYVRSDPQGRLVVPTVHPSFIQRGQSRWSAAFINDLQKAVHLATIGYPPQVYEYVLDPSPMEALQWARDYRERLKNDPTIRLAYDIETPYKQDEDEEDLTEDIETVDEVILRVGFAYEPFKALSIPFDGAYRAAIQLLLESTGDKVVWNGSFDTPRLRRQGLVINGSIHDGMIAWHVLHSDLPKGLGFVATFTCPWQEEWKHLSNSRPAFYNATDADVELRSMIAIEADLRKSPLWTVYERDVVQLEPILEFMSAAGMPVDAGVRREKAIELAKRQSAVLSRMIEVVPQEARRIQHVYKKTPKDTTGLVMVEALQTVKRCSVCGEVSPKKAHFTDRSHGRGVHKSILPGCTGSVVQSDELTVCYAKQADFKPSREQLIRYNEALNRPVPTKYDKISRGRKASMDVKAIKKLMGTYEDDLLYPLVLEYRTIDKLLGTYLGRPVDNES